MKVVEMMSRDPLYVEENDFATKARQLIRDHHVRGLPVLNSDGMVRGIVTDRDMLMITSTRSNLDVAGLTVDVPLITEDMDIMDAARIMLNEKAALLPVVHSRESPSLKGVVSLLDIFGKLDLDKVPRKKIEEVMSKNVVVSTPDEPVTKVWDKMLESDFTGLPVLDNGKPMGMITRFDILKRGWARLGKEDPAKSRNMTKLRVEKLMSTPLFSVSPEGTIREAIEFMLKHEVGRVSVVENEKLVGIVDRYDIIKAVLGED